MKAVIIEDEVRTARYLQSILETEHDIRVMAIIPSVEKGIEFFKTDPEVDVIFSDIEIADGLCFDLFNAIRLFSPVIFCTAYNQYALDAFKANGIDYLIKPFSSQSVSEAIRKFKRLTHHSETDKLFSRLKDSLTNKRNYVLVTLRGKTLPIALSTIAYFYLGDTTTWLYADGHEYAYTKSLDEIEAMLDSPQQFYRANRQYLINRDYVREVEQYFARKLVIKLTVPSKQTIVVSKAKATHFIQWLDH